MSDDDELISLEEPFLRLWFWHRGVVLCFKRGLADGVGCSYEVWSGYTDRLTFCDSRFDLEPALESFAKQVELMKKRVDPKGNDQLMRRAIGVALELGVLELDARGNPAISEAATETWRDLSPPVTLSEEDRKLALHVCKLLQEGSPFEE